MSAKRVQPSKHKRKSKPSAAIIGSGRLGTAIGIALADAGYDIRLVVALHERSAQRAAKVINRQAGAASISQVLGGRAASLCDVELILIATPDDAIHEVAKQLAAGLSGISKRDVASNSVALHTSGALTADELLPLRANGFAIGSIHPLISISEPASGAAWLAKAFFALEGDKKAVRIARQMVIDLGAHSFQISPMDKPLYHAAALMASPNLTALFDLALIMLTGCGLSRARARQVLLPLVQSTLDNLKIQDPAAALTGPLKRGDVATIAKHISAIKTAKLREVLPAYVALARHSASLANDLRKREEMLQLLGDALEARHE